MDPSAFPTMAPAASSPVASMGPAFPTMAPATLSPAQMASMGAVDATFSGQQQSVPMTMQYGAFQPAPSAAAPTLLAHALPGVQSAPRVTEWPTAHSPLKRDAKEDKEWQTLRTFFANAFTMFVFAIFAAPTIISLQLGMDVDARYWIGPWGLFAILVPILLLGQHFYHLWMLENKNRRRRYIFVIVTVLPAILFMVIGGTYMTSGKQLYGQLKSDDCESSGGLPQRFYLQEAYEEAQTAHGECIARLQDENGGVPLQRHPSLQSCQEWHDLLEGQNGVVPFKGYKVAPGTLRQHNPSNDHRWQYIANVELNHLCGGFCKQGPPLFASYDLTGRMGGSCSQFVAFKFLSIMHYGLVVFVLGTMILITSITTYLYSRVALTNMGYKSGLTIA